LLRAIGREDLLDDPRMKDGSTRAKYRDVVNAAITAWTETRTKREVMETIAGAGVPCGAVLTTLELLNDPDLHARGMMQVIDHPVRGKVTVPAWPLRMSESHVPLKCAPIHGADSEAIYGAWIGCSPDEVKDMRERKVI
jgi:formyl-CoA transferase